MTWSVTFPLRTAVRTAVALVALAVGGGPAAADGGRLDFKAEPARGSLTGDTASYFVIAVQPGRRIRQAVAITNETSRPMTFAVHAESAATGPLGGVSYSVRERGRHAGGVGWLKLSTARLTLRPKTSTLVPFTVTMPRGGRDGVHLAGISVERIGTTRAGAHRESQQPGVGVVVHSRRIIAVHVTTPGALQSDLQIEKVTAAARPDAMYLLIHLRNEGNTLLTGAGVLRVDGKAPFTQAFKVDTFVPSTAIEYPVRWMTRPVEGQFAVTAEVTSAGKTARWSGDVSVGKQHLEEFDDRSGGVSVKAGNGRTVALLAGACIAFALASMRRRRLREYCDDYSQTS